MTDFNLRKQVDGRLLKFYGPDPFNKIILAADIHRESHGKKCGLFPAGPLVMRMAAAFVRSTQAKRILDIGCGFALERKYSFLRR